MVRDLPGVLDAVLAGIVVIDGEGRLELLNAAACRILETSLEAASGLPLDHLLGSEHPISKLARTVLDRGRASVENERRIERRFANDIVVDVSASPLFGDGEQSGAVLVLRDRTVQRTLEHVVSERESLSTFGKIAAGIAHEVKNPLGGIRGAAEILGSRATDAKTRTAAELIVREVTRIDTLVDDLMVFARGDELNISPVNIHRILDEVLDLLAMDPIGSGVEVKRAFDPSIPELPADAGRLTQVFLNLIRNALQAMGSEGGTLTIRTRMSLESRLPSPDGLQLPTLLVEVADTGPGIAPDLLDQVATPFFTTRPGGTGLGLAVSRHWVARHGGTLHIDSTPGEGTRVRVALPLRSAT